jgi:hypothetical protein
MDWDILHYNMDVDNRPKTKKLSQKILVHYCIDEVLKRGISEICNKCSGGKPSFLITNLDYQKRKATENKQRNKIY